MDDAADLYRFALAGFDAEARAIAADAGFNSIVEDRCRMARHGHFMACLRAVRCHDGTFQPQDYGRRVLVIPELRHGRHVDNIAFAPSHPDRLASYNGGSVMLGENTVEEHLAVDGEAEIFADVLSWMRAGCAGGVIVDWSRPAWVLQRGRIIVPNVEIGERIERTFRRISGPAQIMVRQAAKAAQLGQVSSRPRISRQVAAISQRAAA